MSLLTVMPQLPLQPTLSGAYSIPRCPDRSFGVLPHRRRISFCAPNEFIPPKRGEINPPQKRKHERHAAEPLVNPHRIVLRLKVAWKEQIAAIAS
jgi:hypothetical protein